MFPLVAFLLTYAMFTSMGDGLSIDEALPVLGFPAVVYAGGMTFYGIMAPRSSKHPTPSRPVLRYLVRWAVAGVLLGLIAAVVAVVIGVRSHYAAQAVLVFAPLGAASGLACSVPIAGLWLFVPAKKTMEAQPHDRKVMPESAPRASSDRPPS